MRCYACNNILTTSEATARFKGSGDFTELCNKCISTIDDDVEVTEGNDDDEDFDDSTSE